MYIDRRIIMDILVQLSKIAPSPLCSQKSAEDLIVPEYFDREEINKHLLFLKNCGFILCFESTAPLSPGSCTWIKIYITASGSRFLQEIQNP